MSGRSPSPPRFSKGHGAKSDVEAVIPGKTEIRPSAVESVMENWSKAKPLGTTRFGSAPVDLVAVPRRSDPKQFRVFGKKTGGGGKDGPTSFPVSVSKIPSLSLSPLGHGESFTDEPHSPRPPSPRSPSPLPVVPVDPRRAASTSGSKPPE